MVRQVNPLRTPGWKAALAVAVAVGALLWHLLACTESPMAFSPGGDLAFVTMEPYAGGESRRESLILAGPRAYRLMILSKDGKLRVLEETTRHMLLAPGWSRDGKRLCYLRIPLLSGKALEQMRATARKRKELYGRATSRPAVEWPLEQGQPRPAEAPTTQADDDEGPDGMPPLENVVEFLERVYTGPLVPLTLVVRDANTGKVLSTDEVELPLLGMEDEEEEEVDFMLAYTRIRPQWGPKGEWVYLCGGQAAVAVRPNAGSFRVITASAENAVLSPDGRTLATIQEGAVGFFSTDGASAVYRRWQMTDDFPSMAWIDNRTLALLEHVKEGEKLLHRLHRIRRDGSAAKSTLLRLPKHAYDDDRNPGQLAIAPDGKHMAIAYEKDVFFMKASGQVLRHWRSENEIRAQPTFTPDSRHVAMKCFTKEDEDEVGYLRVAWIVYYTPDGKEVRRVKIPPIRPGTTRSASRPATAPAAEEASD